MSSLTDKTPAYAILKRQAIILAAFFLALLIVGWVHAYSALLGGAIVILSNAYLANKIFGHYQAQQPDRLVNNYYRATIGKMIVTISLFVLVFLLVSPISIESFIAAYLLVQILPNVTNF